MSQTHEFPAVSTKFLDMIKARQSKSVSNLATPQKFHCEQVCQEQGLCKEPTTTPIIYTHDACDSIKTFNVCRPTSYMKRNYFIPKVSASPRTKNPATRGSPVRNAFQVKSDSVYRPIVIDGSNVAMAHGNRQFSWRGIEVIVDEFLKRGHTDITVVLPKSREGAFRHSMDDYKIATRLIKSGCIAWAPARQSIDGMRMNPYDDRFIIKIALIKNGVIVSNDQYRDLMKESDEWKSYIKYNLLMFTVYEDNILLPDDPLGREGPHLDDFLRLRKKEIVKWNIMKSRNDYK